MKVLFVYSANKNNGNSLVENQANSISSSQQNIEIFTFKIKGKGPIGYLKNLPKFISFIKKINPDVIHAHYSLSGIFATLSLTRRPIIVSLMGSDVNTNGIWKFILLFFSKFWKATIVKSLDMQSKCLIKKTLIIPNGVDLKKFQFIDKKIAQNELNLNSNKKYILFLADPSRKEKNFELAQKSYNLIKNIDVELLVVHSIPHSSAVKYFYAADIILLTSIYEGSPNVIKEAMACNKKIVATPVGDIPFLIHNLNGCYLTDFKPETVATSLSMALNNDENINSRERLIRLSLDAESVAKKIIQIYTSFLS